MCESPISPSISALRHERRDRVDDQDVDGAAAHQGLGDLQRLLAVVRLRDQQVVGLHAELLGIAEIERMLGVDEGRHAAALLRFGDDLQRQGGFAGGFRAVDLDHAAARHAADAERDVESERAGGNRLHVLDDAALAELHDRAFAELFLDLTYREVDRLFPIHIHCLPPTRLTGR